jgi:hypothetical protein
MCPLEEALKQYRFRSDKFNTATGPAAWRVLGWYIKGMPALTPTGNIFNGFCSVMSHDPQMGFI